MVRKRGFLLAFAHLKLSKLSLNFKLREKRLHITVAVSHLLYTKLLCYVHEIQLLHTKKGVKKREEILALHFLQASFTKVCFWGQLRSWPPKFAAFYVNFPVPLISRKLNNYGLCTLCILRNRKMYFAVKVLDRYSESLSLSKWAF